MAYSQLSSPFQSMIISMGNEFLCLPKFATDILDDTYTCVYCKNTLRPPVLQLSCGHRVCGQECIEKMRSEGLQSCPSMEDEICRKVDIKDESNIYPDMGITRQLLKFIVFCHNNVNGCPEKLAWKDLESHLQVCKFVLVECENAFRGCEVKLPKHQIKDHQEKECLYVYIVCSQCSQNVLKVEMENHLKDCLLKLNQCSFSSIGCDFVGESPSDMDKHKKQNILNHLLLLKDECAKFFANIVHRQSELHDFRSLYLEINAGILQISEDTKQIKAKFDLKSKNLQKLTANNAEKIIGIHKLEEIFRSVVSIQDQFKSQEARIEQLESGGGVGNQNVPTGLVSTLNGIQTSIQRQESTMSENDVKIQCMETTSYDGKLIWKIGPYMKRKDEATSTQVVSIFSQPFYTDRYGYKMCLRLYLNGDGMGKGSHISVYLSIMQGEYDALLVWPFRNKVSITIMDQDSRRKNITDSFRPDPTSKSFLRPVSEYNIASGFPLFMAQSIVESPTYLKDDTIFIKATID